MPDNDASQGGILAMLERATASNNRAVMWWRTSQVLMLAITGWATLRQIYRNRRR